MSAAPAFNPGRRIRADFETKEAWNAKKIRSSAKKRPDDGSHVASPTISRIIWRICNIHKDTFSLRPRELKCTEASRIVASKMMKEWYVKLATVFLL